MVEYEYFSLIFPIFFQTKEKTAHLHILEFGSTHETCPGSEIFKSEIQNSSIILAGLIDMATKDKEALRGQKKDGLRKPS